MGKEAGNGPVRKRSNHYLLIATTGIQTRGATPFVLCLRPLGYSVISLSNGQKISLFLLREARSLRHECSKSEEWGHGDGHRVHPDGEDDLEPLL